MLGSIATQDILAATHAARSGHEVVSVVYRLAPAHPFPAGLHDCIAVTKALAKIHEPLTPKQRAQLAYLVRTGTLSI